MPITVTNTYTYTKPRVEVLGDQVEFFVRCMGVGEELVQKFLNAVKKHELKAIGVYLKEDEGIIAEVEFRIDWDKHKELINITGEFFDTDQPGWKDGISVEVYVYVSRLVKFARENSMEVFSWIIVSDEIMSNPKKHKLLCDELGYEYGKSIPEWKRAPTEKKVSIEGLEEGMVAVRQI